MLMIQVRDFVYAMDNWRTILLPGGHSVSWVTLVPCPCNNRSNQEGAGWWLCFLATVSLSAPACSCAQSPRPSHFPWPLPLLHWAAPLGQHRPSCGRHGDRTRHPEKWPCAMPSELNKSIIMDTLQLPSITSYWHLTNNPITSRPIGVTLVWLGACASLCYSIFRQFRV